MIELGLIEIIYNMINNEKFEMKLRSEAILVGISLFLGGNINA